MNRHSHAVEMRRMRRCVYATISDMTLPHGRLDDVEWLRARRAEGRAVKVLAELHVDHWRVSAALRRAGLPVPLAVVHVSRLHDRDWLAATLREYSMEEVAWALKCSRTSVRYAVRRVRLVDDRRSQASSGRRCDARRPPVASASPGGRGDRAKACSRIGDIVRSGRRGAASIRTAAAAAERVAPGVPAAVRRRVGGSDGSADRS